MKFNSFSELGEHMGVKPRKRMPHNTKKCLSCGGEMVRVPGTNVFICHGKDEEGNPCKRRALSK